MIFKKNNVIINYKQKQIFNFKGEMIMEKKLTKKDFYAAIRAMVEGIEMVGDIPAEEVPEAETPDEKTE